MLTSDDSMLIPPHSGPGGAATNDPEAAANPTDFLLVFGLLKTDLETIGLVEIFQRFEAGAEAQAGYLRFLSQMCELAGDFLKSHQLRHFSDRQTLWTQLEDFTRTVHASLNPRETAYTIVNEGRRLIECDRVTVAIRRGKKCRIEAISGQDLFDKRSNTVRLLANWPPPSWPLASPCGTRATPATWPRRSKRPCRNTSTKPTRRPSPSCPSSVSLRRKTTTPESASNQNRRSER